MFIQISFFLLVCVRIIDVYLSSFSLSRDIQKFILENEPFMLLTNFILFHLIYVMMSVHTYTNTGTHLIYLIQSGCLKEKREVHLQ